MQRSTANGERSMPTRLREKLHWSSGSAQLYKAYAGTAISLVLATRRGSLVCAENLYDLYM